MESKKSQLSPLSLERRQDLFVYAITSLHEDYRPENMDNKIGVSLIASYNDREAILGAIESINRAGLDAEKFRIPFQLVKVPARSLIKSGGTNIRVEKVVSPALPILQEEKNKTVKVENFIADVLYVFDAVGDEEQKKLAMLVIEKFRKHAKRFTEK